MVVIALLSFVLLFGRKLGLPVDLMSLMTRRQIFIPAADWREVVSSEGGFSVLMPANPVVSGYSDAGHNGKSYTVADKDRRYSFSALSSDGWTDMPTADIGPSLNALAAEAVQRGQGTVLSEQSLTLDAVPGKECVFEKDGVVYRSQWYAKGAVRYQLSISSNKEFVASRNAERFFGSFKIVRATAGRAADIPGWTEVSDAAGRFSVLMPGAPSRETERINDPWGEMRLFHFTLRNGPIEKLAVEYLDLPEPYIAGKTADAILKSAGTVDAFNIGGKVTSERSLPLEHFPGRELQVENAAVAMRIRLYLVDRRLYKVLAARPKSRAFSADDERFLSSFRLTE